MNAGPGGHGRPDVPWARVNGAAGTDRPDMAQRVRVGDRVAIGGQDAGDYGFGVRMSAISLAGSVRLEVVSSVFDSGTRVRAGPVSGRAVGRSVSVEGDWLMVPDGRNAGRAGKADLKR